MQSKSFPLLQGNRFEMNSLLHTAGALDRSHIHSCCVHKYLVKIQLDKCNLERKQEYSFVTLLHFCKGYLHIE